MQQVPAVRRRKLGAELRRQRDLAGLTSGEAARRAGWHQSKVSRIETGRSAARPEDVTVLLDIYGVRDRELRDLLATLAGEGTQRGWWHDFRDVLPPEYRDFISLETGASRARTMENSVVPGLLQTPAYARALTRSVLPQLAEREIDALVDVRVARQAVLEHDSPLELHALLDEAVLRRKVGGEPVMGAQIQHLAEAATMPQIRLQVLPFTAGGHIGVTGSFVIFSFPFIADLDVVVLDHLTSTLYVDRKEDIRAYSAAFDRLRAHALSCDESLAFISGINKGA
ncbi:helix-turn-helix transcriptional regulator [Streptomyces sp. H10-C2]|uniref:helix-turn-helix domain-containing protein n=1 Tax=unclassified Streptomyces TaxID=2593676 RepID=UPI0024BB955A|nr:MULTISPECIES: helix-turn-helix transcriptional regulator [unclassified Streptomyces]MDJ0344101.1 helix-turn-helix transcriptional regulator [Streptomyces sp. PH10-H1]MDJ0368640.1 helix-turn-helix transcriptional regulator [Streptomyces sp. H10-C2]